MITINDFLSDELAINDAFNSLLAIPKGSHRHAYDPEGIYVFWNDEKWSVKKNSISITRKNINHTSYVQKRGGARFYGSLLKKYQSKEKVFVLFRDRGSRKACILVHNDMPLLGDVQVKFKSDGGEQNVNNIDSVTIKFSLDQNNIYRNSQKSALTKVNLMNETRRIRSIERREERTLDYWHGVIQNRVGDYLKRRKIEFALEYQIDGRRIDMVSFPEGRDHKVINIYEVKTHPSRIVCEKQSIVQLIDYRELAIKNGYIVKKLITVGYERSEIGWSGNLSLDKSISEIWEYQAVSE